MTLLEVIKTAPSVINHILNDNLQEIKTKVESHIAGHNFNKVVIIASGSSYNAAFLVKYFCEKELGVKMELNYPNVFLHSANLDLYDTDDLFVFISQGGETKEVYHSIELLKERGHKTLSITENVTGSIAKISDTCIPMGTHDEPYLFRTIGYDATYVTLILVLVQVFGTNTINVVTEIHKMSDNLLSIVSQAQDFYKVHQSSLIDASGLVFAGSGELWPASQEAAIKFMEMIPIYTLSYELEESIHGPQNAFNNKAAYFINANHGADLLKAQSIHQFIQNEISENVFLISDIDIEQSYQLNLSDSQFNALEYVVFYQTLAYYLATDRGKDLSKVTYPQLTNYIKKKFED